MNRWTRATAVTAAIILFSPWLGMSRAQQMVFPGADWERASPESQLINSVRLNAAVEYLSPYFGDPGRELVVIRNGRLIWESPNIDHARDVTSATKVFTSTVLGLLIDDGRATLDTLAMSYLPNMAADYLDVTLRHFATMTSGYLPVGVPFAPATPLFSPPGSQFSYSNSAMEQLSNVLTQIAGEPIEDLFRRRIAEPIGMSGWDWPDWAHFNPPDSVAAVNRGSTGLEISAGEAARLGHLFLNRGRWDGQQLISTEWVDEATSVQVPASLPAHPANPSGTWGPGVYGYNWVANGVGPDGLSLYPGAPPGAYSAIGLGDNRIFVVPEWDMVFAKTSGGDPWDDSRWGVFISQIGSAMLPDSGTITLDLPPEAVYAVIDDTFDDSGDRAVDVSTSDFAEVGEVDESDRNEVSRVVAKFALPDAPDGKPTLQKARLGVLPITIEGPPLESLSVWHSLSDDDTDQLPSDYENLSYTDTLEDIVEPNDELHLYYDVDVTDQVLGDYATDGPNPMSAFRLQLDGASYVEDQVSHDYVLTMPGGTYRPQLLLTFAPELEFGADFDGDGDVDGDDFLTWQTGFGTPAGALKSDGDYDNDGDVDGDDFLGWQSEFGSGSGSANGAAPEPATGLLLLLGTGCCIALFRTRSKCF